MSTQESQVPGVNGDAEEQEDEVQEVETGVAVKEVSTKNARFGEIKVQVRVPLAPSVQDYSSEDFYGSEEAVKKALDADWTRRKANSARPVLRDAETQMNWQEIAQRTADSYKPGRRGGFTPTVDQDQLRQATSIDDVIRLLQEKGIQIV